ncbi:8179_t:CDS:1, partial [Paraglomus brasilianum]
MGINDEEDIPDNVYVENGDDNENGEFDNIVEDISVQSTGETTPLPSTSIQNNEIQTPQITENEP